MYVVTGEVPSRAPIDVATASTQKATVLLKEVLQVRVERMSVRPWNMRHVIAECDEALADTYM